MEFDDKLKYKEYFQSMKIVLTALVCALLNRRECSSINLI